MSQRQPSTREITEKVTSRYPQPIAIAWRKISTEVDEGRRAMRLLECLEHLLRTLGALVLADYLSGPSAESVEALLAGDLSKLTIGGRVNLLKELSKALEERSDRFLYEFPGWWQKPATEKLLSRLRGKRDERSHGVAPSAAILREENVKFGTQLARLLASLDWLVEYPLFRVQKCTALRRGGGQQLSVQIYDGIDTNPVAQLVASDLAFPEDSLFVAHSARGALEIGPLIQILQKKALAERLWVLSIVTSAGEIEALDIDSGRTASVPIRVDGEKFTWKAYLAQREELCSRLSCKLDGALGEDRGQLRGSFLSRDFSAVRELGHGSMGVVYLARDPVGTLCAVKAIREDCLEQAEARTRFEREARMMGSFEHPNVLNATASRGVGNRLLLRMRYVPGGTLEDLIKKNSGPEQPEQVLHFARQIFRALAYVHDHQIVHRDLKPSNLLVDKNERLFLTDFGIARQQGEGGLTERHDRLGTQEYMSPEQLLGREATDKSDVYSAAIVLRELATGSRPGAGERAHEGIEDKRLRSLVKLIDNARPGKRQAARTFLGLIDQVSPDAAKVPLSPAPAVEPLRSTADATEARELGRGLRRLVEAGGRLPLSTLLGFPAAVRQLLDLLRRDHLGTAWTSLLPQLTLGDVMDARGTFVWNRVRDELTQGDPTALLQALGLTGTQLNLRDVETLHSQVFSLSGWVGCLGDSTEGSISEDEFFAEAAKLLGVRGSSTFSELLDVLPHPLYTRKLLPKRGGGKRWLHVPSDQLKAVQEVLLRLLTPYVHGHSAATGFLPQRSTVLHARYHAGAKAAVIVDIHDFFGSVLPRQVGLFNRVNSFRYLPPNENSRGPFGYWSLRGLAFLEGITFTRELPRTRCFLPQGAPTSPLLANVAAFEMDAKIHQFAATQLNGMDWTYSRYADDLVISSRVGGHDFHEEAEEVLRRGVTEMEWTVSPRKVRHWSSNRGGPLVLCGIRVPADRDGTLELPRSTRRRLRSAVRHLHEGKADSRACGLVAYAYAVTHRHALRALNPGRTQRRVQKLAQLVADDPVAFYAGWTENALE
jgi:serine/threonine protein kinase